MVFYKLYNQKAISFNHKLVRQEKWNSRENQMKAEISFVFSLGRINWSLQYKLRWHLLLRSFPVSSVHVCLL